MVQKISDTKTQPKISAQEIDQVVLLLKREIQRVAARLIKVRQNEALSYAKEQIDVIAESGEEEDQVYWEKIAAEVERQLNP